MSNQPSPKNFSRWFDPRYKQIGSWAFILNRITALGLTLYLVMHLFMLSKLAVGPEAYDSFIKLAKSPLIKFGESLVIIAVMIHGLNGIRIVLNSMGIWVNKQKQLFVTFMVLALIGSIIFILKMFISG